MKWSDVEANVQRNWTVLVVETTQRVWVNICNEPFPEVLPTGDYVFLPAAPRFGYILFTQPLYF